MKEVQVKRTTIELMLGAADGGRRSRLWRNHEMLSGRR